MDVRSLLVLDRPFLRPALLVAGLFMFLVLLWLPDVANAAPACYGFTASDEAACTAGKGLWVDTNFTLSDVASKLVLVVFSVTVAIIALYALLVSFNFGIAVLGDSVAKILSRLRMLIRGS